MSDDPNDRAARLAGRWGSDEGREDEAVVDGVAEDDSEPGDGGAGEVAESAGVESGDADPSVDDDDRELTTREMQSQMLYLPPEFHKELDLTFEELNLRFRRERDRRLQKNKDFYAGLLRLGLEQLGSVRERDLDELEDVLEL